MKESEIGLICGIVQTVVDQPIDIYLYLFNYFFIILPLAIIKY